MDKNAIKKYAVWARRELISRVSQRAAIYGITENDLGNANDTSVNGNVLSATEKKQRQALIGQIRSKGYEQVMEEVAYTWFNRFSALRFMEVNGYLPSHVRVFTDDENAFKPQILTEAINLEIEGIDMEKVYVLKNANDNDELFKYLIILQCNALSEILPGMFQRIADYTELLFPDNLLREGSAVEQMIAMIPQEDWQDAVQILGWLYQYYNTEKKDDVSAALKKNVKITKENIPAATQLFTPDWIVRYMVENSLGRLWVEGHPNDELKANWKYYLEEAEQESEVQAQLVEIRKEYAALNPEDIKCIDPCSGSGHILAYMFDVLVQIYEAHGYTTRDAVRSIVENNIYGLDIDDRATQLAYFAVMMKARQYDRRFFSRGIQPNVFAIEESNGIDKNLLQYFGYGMDELNKNVAKTQLEGLLEQMHDAKEYGSIINVDACDWKLLREFVAEYDAGGAGLFDTAGLFEVQGKLQKLVSVAQALGQKYHSVVTNPPYMGTSSISGKLSDYVKSNYEDSKFDLYAVFIERCMNFSEINGFQSMITQHSWMFIASFKRLRQKLLTIDIENMIHLGARAFEEIAGEVVQTTSFVLRKANIAGFCGTYCRLVAEKSQDAKEKTFLRGEKRFTASKASFSKIAGTTIAYWASTQLISAYSYPKVSEYMECKSGIMTGSDNYIKLWHEPSIDAIKFDCDSSEDMGTYKWFPINSGGEYRKWYGNNQKIVNLQYNGAEIRSNVKNYRLRDRQYYFKIGITWGRIATSQIAFREVVPGSLFGDAGPVGFIGKHRHYVLGFLCSNIVNVLLQVTNPTQNFQVHDIMELPLVIRNELSNEIEKIVQQNVLISKFDWDSFESSWEFKRHPIVRCVSTLSEAFTQFDSECRERFDRLKANEEELNRIFIDIYGLQDELTPKVEEKDVTVRKADLQREVKSFISYAVGCMFGRYSLDVDGLAYAGGTWDAEKYTSFTVDPDNIIPICDDEYFGDDIVGRFVEFISIVYGEATLAKNLRFIADALGGSGQPKEVIRKYFLNDFYKDHCKTYQKRPIYWLFDSGKKGGFKCLIYMHRYQPDTIARIRTDYVHEQQSRYRTVIDDLQNRIASAGTSERVKLNKKLKNLQEQAEEIRVYEEKIHHLADQMISIDLDDGVKVNYAKFQDVLAKIK